MGGVGSKPGTIGIIFDQTTACPGTQVSGRVVLGVTKDRMSCNSLNLRFSGAENTMVRYTTHSGSGKNRRTHRHTTRQQSVFLDADFVLTNFPSGDVPEGSYEFPFTLTIPPGMPFTMYCSLPGDHGGTAEVKYVVHARLHRPGWLKWDVENFSTLHVRPLPSNHVPRHPLYSDPQRVRIHTMCCFHRGDFVLSMSSPSSVLCIGESFPVYFALLNHSTAKIKSFRFTLTETVSWVANGRRRTSNMILNAQTLDGEHVDIATAQGKRDADVHDSRGDFAAVQQMLQQQTHFVKLVVAETARPSMTGALISVSHRLTMDITTGFGTSNASFTYPVTVIPSPAPNAPYMIAPEQVAPVVELPANWSPTTAPVVALPVPAYAPPKMHDATEGDLAPPPPYEYPASGPYSSVGGGTSTPPSTGFEALQFEMNNTYNRLAALEKWLPNNSADDLTPQQIYTIFNGFADTVDQLSCARALSNCMTRVTCEHIASAAAGSSDLVRRQVVEELAPKCVDKHNHALVQDKLTPFQYMIVEKCFQ